MGAASKLNRSRWQIDCFDTTSLKASTLAEAVRDAIDGFQGFWGAANIRRCHMTGEKDNINFPVDGSHVPDHRQTLEFEIDYFRSIPSLAS